MKGYMDDNKAQINMPTHVNFFKNDIRPEQKHKWVMTEDDKSLSAATMMPQVLTRRTQA